MKKQDLQKIKKVLEEEKKKLENFLNEFAKKKKKGEDWDVPFPQYKGDNLEEEADEVEEYSALLTTERSLESRLHNINLALEKIKKGSYGKCEKCRKSIPQKRLKVVPEARFCLKCEK